MSCAEVMYQPYSPYFPYHHQRPGPSTADHYRKFVKPHTEVSSSSLVDPCTPSPPAQPPPPPPSLPETKEKGGVEAQYLSANCVLFTYYSGDISSVVDEHFARALSQAYPAAAEAKAQQAKDGPPMSHRNFPPSFWNSNYQPMPSSHPNSTAGGLSELSAYGTDPYHHHPGSLHATLHHQNDPWAAHYSLTGQAGGFPHTYHHPAMSSATPRFAPNYPSLLLQAPSMRSSRLGPSAACSSLEKSEAWSAARYHHDPIMEPGYGAYGAMAPMPADTASTAYMSMYEVLQNMQRSYR